MSKPVFDDLFRFRGRRNRRSYILYGLAAGALLLVLTSVLVIVGASSGDNVGTAVAVAWLAGLLPFSLSVCAVTSQRCRDAGWTGWIAILVLVPYLGAAVFLVLCLVPGDRDANRYGADPLSGGTASAPLRPGLA